MREIVLDTETTGLDPAKGHRVVEIGAIELINLIPTGKSFHAYLNPERDMPEEAFRVHGLSGEFLSAQKKFAEVAREFCAFIAGGRLVIHNAEFDVKFLNAELSRLELPALDMSIVTDTLALARRRHPGAANSLDALCQRFGVDARAARSTALFSTPSFSLKSMASSWAAAKRLSPWRSSSRSRHALRRRCCGKGRSLWQAGSVQRKSPPIGFSFWLLVERRYGDNIYDLSRS